MGERDQYNLSHGRTAAQIEQMQDLAARGVCAFCREHFEANHREPLLYENDYWLLTKNDYPYEGAVTQLLLIHKTHIERPEEIKPEGWVALGEAIKTATSRFSFPGGSFLMRFGNSDYCGSTVSHLHAHLIVGGDRNSGSDKLRTMVGYMKGA